LGAKNLEERVSHPGFGSIRAHLDNHGRAPMSSRVNSAFQLTSHVVPPSAEKACSKRNDAGVTFANTNRTSMARPSRGSRPKTDPRPSLAPPNIVAPSSIPSRALAQLIFHWRVFGLYKRSVNPSIRPAGPSTASSPRFARPSHTFRTVDVPSYSSHFVDP